MKYTKILIAILLVTTLALSACSAGDMFSGAGRKQTADPNRNYYTGTQGVTMMFSDPSSPPSRMYYHSDASPDDNVFDVIVDLHNEGTAYTLGALYISGYDPSMIELYDEEGQALSIIEYGADWGDCLIDVGFSGNAVGGSFWNSISGAWNCAGMGVSGHRNSADDWGFKVNSLSPFLDLVGVESNFLDGISLAYDSNPGGDHLSLGFDDDFNFEYLNHGRGMIIYLEGINFRQYNGLEYRLKPDLADYPGGERDSILFRGEIRNFPQGLDQAEVPIMVTNCYLYATYAAPQVCIDPDPFSQERKVCYPQRITYNKGTGAPVKITSIEQVDSSNKGTTFVINIDNVGGGTVYDATHIEQCSPYYPIRPTTRVYNKVYLTDVRIGNQHLTCTPDRWDGVRLDNGHGEVRCHYDYNFQRIGSAFQTPLIVEVAYGYAETMKRTMTVKKSY
ncbi:hypothetical protein JXA48_01035 [Candidatus Woesearchaeota archaeon]|nr:hypothetical protein [Candidatus Woesearchaeota archaeon]